MRKMTLLLTAAMLMLPAVAAGDIVVFKDGRRIEGLVSDLGKDLRIEFEFGHTVVPKSLVDQVIACDTPRQKYEKKLKAIKPSDIEELKKLHSWCTGQGLKKEAKELAVRIGKIVLQEKESAVDSKDASALVELAMWCRRNGYDDSVALTYLWKVLSIDPDHAAVREMLGYRRFRGQWLKKEDVSQIRQDEYDKEMRLKGMVKHKSQWLKPDTRELLLQSEKLDDQREDLERQRQQVEDDRRKLTHEKAQLDQLNRTLYTEQTKLERCEDQLERTARSQADLALRIARERVEQAELRRTLERREAELEREKERIRDEWDEIEREKRRLHMLRRRTERERRELDEKKK